MLLGIKRENATRMAASNTQRNPPPHSTMHAPRTKCKTYYGTSFINAEYAEVNNQVTIWFVYFSSIIHVIVLVGHHCLRAVFVVVVVVVVVVALAL